ncbi:hypothetical protein [Roseivirga pacifica]|uniref:hypothetical protein n=1 Tax=Roseivirga pacifica TaxID=1267423 RepID=UPI0020942D26|nr:hypothetical protein [Roseivirga pacifica]MCO6357792.1 hypothetical protein [Roseivirga pacifica]MCO6366045.1 hypothetical protein [Roseivirga pacifica]MCO6371373.1 hypothetical protein [Roseivirga pacifica]MCO6375455.1 hypothetical protein [Roseivirga pacifica]MCO6378751.1 hypothetical protein [Roseivirga pacifica]
MKIKDRPILKIAISISLIVELILVALVYDKIGSARLPYQLTRLAFELIVIYLAVPSRLKVGLFLLSGFHVFSGLSFLFFKDTVPTGDLIFGIYHLTIAFLIYFHDLLEKRFIKSQN